MGVTKKAKITFTCEPSLKDGLEEWAQSESRTLSNLIEMLIRQAYEERFSSADRTTDPHHRPAAKQEAKQTAAKQEAKQTAAKQEAKQTAAKQTAAKQTAAKRTAAKRTTAPSSKANRSEVNNGRD